MGQVNVVINGRSYTVACDDGEEGHLRQLADYIDSYVEDLTQNVGQVGDARLLLMAGLLISDELWEARQKLDQLSKEIEGLRDSRSSALDRSQEAETSVASILDSAARRIEDMARRIEAA